MAELNNHTDAYLLEGPSPLRKARNQDEEENQDMKSKNINDLCLRGITKNNKQNRFEYILQLQPTPILP